MPAHAQPLQWDQYDSFPICVRLWFCGNCLKGILFSISWPPAAVSYFVCQMEWYWFYFPWKHPNQFSHRHAQISSHIMHWYNTNSNSLLPFYIVHETSTTTILMFFVHWPWHMLSILYTKSYKWIIAVFYKWSNFHKMKVQELFIWYIVYAYFLPLQTEAFDCFVQESGSIRVFLSDVACRCTVTKNSDK